MLARCLPHEGTFQLGFGYDAQSLIVAAAGFEGRVQCVPRDPERLEIDIGKDAAEELRGGRVVRVPSAVIGPRQDGVVAGPLGIDQPAGLVGPFGGASGHQPLTARRIDRIWLDGGDVPNLPSRSVDSAARHCVRRSNARPSSHPRKWAESLKTPPPKAS